MEVSTVSPSPASPTEGDDLCDTDATSVAIHSVTLLICLCGLAGNGAVLWVLNLKIRNYGIFDLAVADFLFLLFAVPSTLLFLVEDVSCSSIMPLMYVTFIFQLSEVSYYWGLSRLMRRRNVLYMQKFCKLCCRCDLPVRLFWVVNSAQYWAFFAVFTVIPPLTLLCPSHEQGHCRAALISMYALILLLFAAPVVTSRTSFLINAKWGSQQQQPARHDIVILLIMVLTLLLSFCNFLQQLGYMFVASQVYYLLACINSTINPFTYFLAGRCRRPFSVESLRLSLQRVFEEQKGKTACRKATPRKMGN